MEAIQAAIERLNENDDIDEAELERLEQEIDKMLGVAGLPPISDDTTEDEPGAEATASSGADGERRASQVGSQLPASPLTVSVVWLARRCRDAVVECEHERSLGENNDNATATGSRLHSWQLLNGR
jgi:hypothetical protein